MKYTRYVCDDFVRDEHFKSWVVAPDEHSDSYWRAFLENHPDKAREISRAREIILALDFASSSGLVVNEQMKQDMYESILKDSRVGSEGRYHRGSSIYLYRAWERSWWTARAAAILLIATLSGILWYYTHDLEVPAEKFLVQQVRKEAPTGQKLTVVLPDRSFVKLNSGATLTYENDFSRKRQVALQGEAFFDIHEDPLHPFTVLTGEVETTVLGTSFNIEEDDRTGEIHVAVLTGKVRIAHQKENLQVEEVVMPDQMASISLRKGTLQIREFDYDEVFGWKDNLLSFKDANLDDIIPVLERWYGVEFKIQKEISKDRDFTGSYRDKSLETVLKGIGFAFRFDFEINGNVVTIK